MSSRNVNSKRGLPKTSDSRGRSRVASSGTTAIRLTVDPRFWISAFIALNGLVNIIVGLLPVFAKQWTAAPAYLQIEGLRATGLISVFIGFLLLYTANRLFKRERRAWWIALCLTVLIIAINIIRGSWSLAALLPAIILLILLIVFRDRFTKKTSSISITHLLAAGSVVISLGYAIIGSYVLRDGFDTIESWSDAVYYTIVTFSTVGYGDIVPITDDARWFTMSMIVLGIVSFVGALTVLVGPIWEGKIREVLKLVETVEHKNHTVVIGQGNMAQAIANKISALGKSVVIIGEHQPEDESMGAVKGDPTHQSTLVSAGIETANTVIICDETDAINSLVLLTIQNCATKDDLKVISWAHDEENIDKMKSAGAHHVVSPIRLGADLIADMLES